MIAALHFERRHATAPAEPLLEPGLRRIDEILAVVLARYEATEPEDAANNAAGLNAGRFSSRSSAEFSAAEFDSEPCLSGSKPRPR